MAANRQRSCSSSRSLAWSSGPGWFCASPELPQLERECLGPPNEMGELRTSAFRLGRAEGRSGLHARSRAPLPTDGHCSVAMLKA